jgi:phosphinothricin acetyltransferase
MTSVCIAVQIKCAHYKEIGKKFGQLLDVVAYQKIM